jgi:hypothetical protein
MNQTVLHALRSCSLLLFQLGLPVLLLAQDKALPCILSADFEGEGIPAGWDIGAAVVQLDGSGNTTAAWRIGNAQEANANGFFPVPDVPVGNRFIMANDDASPCNCAMDEVILTSPSIDLTTITGAVLECRYFLDGNFNSGHAVVDASVNGADWAVVDTLDPLDDWQASFLDVSTYDGTPDLRIRFRWSDNGQWASGLAVDDFCVRGRLAQDVSVVELLTHDPIPSPFDTGVRSLRYTEVPLVQAEAITLAAWVRNSGTAIMRGISVVPSISLNGVDQGTIASQFVDSLMPGERRLVRIPTGWTPNGTGQVQFTVNTSSTGPDEDGSDNTATANLRITGPGWSDGYSAMTSLLGPVQGSVTEEGQFVALSRMELSATPVTPSGISAVFGPGTSAGAIVRGILLDANLTFLDTSIRQTLTGTEMERIALGEPLYFPMVNGIAVSGDVFAGIQYIDSDGSISIATSGTSAEGSSLVIQGNALEVDPLSATPMIRLHFTAFGVGIPEQDHRSTIMLHPNPASSLVRCTTARSALSDVVVVDMSGMELRVPIFPGASEKEVILDVSTLAGGVYLVRTGTGPGGERGRLVITR